LNIDTDDNIKEEAYIFLGSLCIPVTKDPHRFFLENNLESWVRYYRAFLIDPIKSKVVKKRIQKLGCQTIVCFVNLIHLIWIDIDGVEAKKWEPTFFGRKVNDFSQFNFALNVCLSIKNDIDCIKDSCWLSEKVNNNGYPESHYTEVEVTCHTKQQGTRIYSIEGGFDSPILVHRWVCSLKTLNIKYTDSTRQAAHRCLNKSCFNPYHIKNTSDAENKDDKGCKYGCAHYCPHEPKCIWNSNDGRWLPCRNDVSQAISKHSCTHVPNCFI